MKEAQWKFSGDKHKSLQVDTERTFHQRYLSDALKALIFALKDSAAALDDLFL